MPLPTNITAGQADHYDLHNKTNQAVNKIAVPPHVTVTPTEAVSGGFGAYYGPGWVTIRLLAISVESPTADAVVIAHVDGHGITDPTAAIDAIRASRSTRSCARTLRRSCSATGPRSKSCTRTALSGRSATPIRKRRASRMSISRPVPRSQCGTALRQTAGTRSSR